MATTPVGLLGLLNRTSLVRGVMARSMRLGGELEVGVGVDVDGLGRRRA